MADNKKNIDYLKHQLVEHGVRYGYMVKPAKPSTKKNPYVKQVEELPPELFTSGDRALGGVDPLKKSIPHSVSHHLLLHKPEYSKVKNLNKIVDFVKKLSPDEQLKAVQAFQFIFPNSAEGIENTIHELEAEEKALLVHYKDAPLKNWHSADRKRLSRIKDLIAKQLSILHKTQPAEKLFYKQMKQLAKNVKVEKLEMGKSPKPSKPRLSPEWQMSMSPFKTYKNKPTAKAADEMDEETNRVRDLRLGDTMVLGPKKVDYDEEPEEETAAPEPHVYRHKALGDEEEDAAHIPSRDELQNDIMTDKNKAALVEKGRQTLSSLKIGEYITKRKP